MAFEAVKREAERYGVAVRRSEIVGLVPQQAMIDAAIAYLQLHGFSSDQILENRLSPPKGWADFIADLASPAPVPGGGSAAALAGGLGVALLLMVCELTIGKQGYEEVAEHFQALRTRLNSRKERYLELVDEDARAFEAVMAAYKLPKMTDEEKERRSSIVQAALRGACSTPLEVMELARGALSDGLIIAREGNKSSISDAGVGGELLRAAGRGGRLNLLINLTGIKDEVWVKEKLDLISELNHSIESLHQELELAVEARLK
jgi:glutamate formiminotransferase/formiminotetrahydrofolate cyclodeaminase